MSSFSMLFRAPQPRTGSGTARRRSSGRLLVVASVIASMLVLGAFPAQAATLTLASTSTGGTKGNATSEFPSLSADGTKVAFFSQATNLGAGDTDAAPDVYIKNLTTGALTLASTSTGGTKGNNGSSDPSLSADGTKVAFRSQATNLDPGDTDTTGDIYVKNLTTGALTLASTSTGGTKANLGGFFPSLSADGTKVAFGSQATNLDPGDTGSDADVYVKDLTTGTLTLASTSTGGTKGNDLSQFPSLSGDGTKVAFRSFATNLDPGDTDTNSDVYVKDLTTGTLTLASTATGGTKGTGSSFDPSLSGDGTKVAFYSDATNLDPGDTDANHDIYVKDLTTGALALASTGTGGTKGNANSFLWVTSLSGDGTKVGFYSQATNLDPADTDATNDVYVKDLTSGALTLASTSTTGIKGNANSFASSLSGDGTKVAFYSQASNLDPVDRDATNDVFVKVNEVNSPPTVDAGGDVSGTTGSAIALDATVTDPDGDPVTKAWTVPGSVPCTFDDSGATDTSITCTTAGTFTATLTGDDGVNAPVSDTTQVTVANATVSSPPTVDAGGDVSGTTGSAITLDGTVTDPDGDTVTTTWTVPGGTPCTFGTPSAVDTTITCTAAGTFTATLTGDDGVNPPVTDTTQVTVANATVNSPPTVDPPPPPPPSPSPTPPEPTPSESPPIHGSCDEPEVICGTDGADVLTGTDGPDVIIGGDGNDVITGGDGNDVIIGGDGNDVCKGGAGDDAINCGRGMDRIRGGAGNDELQSTAGDDDIRGHAGNDTIRGGAGGDVLRGGTGADLIRGGSGADRLFGGAGRDVLYGGPDDDLIEGGTGRDLMRGGGGDDRFRARDGYVDRVFGGRGRDSARRDDLDEVSSL